MYCEVNGEKTFYSNGNGTLKDGQPSVVFLHGAGMDHSVWVMPARYFARRGYNVYALDFPGHGRSEGTLCQSVPALADWLAQALATLGVAHTAIAGHSMGSLVAINFAARYGDTVRSLALLGTSLPMAVSDPLLNAARDNHHDAINMTNTWSHSSFGLMGGNKNPGNVMTMCGQRLLEMAPQDVLFTDLNACNEFTGGAEQAVLIAAPTLVIVGEQDKMTAPVRALDVAANISNSRVLRLHPCGHSMLSEQPNAVLDGLATII